MFTYMYNSMSSRYFSNKPFHSIKTVCTDMKQTTLMYLLCKRRTEILVLPHKSVIRKDAIHIFIMKIVVFWGLHPRLAEKAEWCSDCPHAAHSCKFHMKNRGDRWHFDMFSLVPKQCLYRRYPMLKCLLMTRST